MSRRYSRWPCYDNSSRKAFGSFRSALSKPSVTRLKGRSVRGACVKLTTSLRLTNNLPHPIGYRTEHSPKMGHLGDVAESVGWLTAARACAPARTSIVPRGGWSSFLATRARSRDRVATMPRLVRRSTSCGRQIQISKPPSCAEAAPKSISLPSPCACCREFHSRIQGFQSLAGFDDSGFLRCRRCGHHGC